MMMFSHELISLKSCPRPHRMSHGRANILWGVPWEAPWADPWHVIHPIPHVLSRGMAQEG